LNTEDKDIVNAVRKDISSRNSVIEMLYRDEQLKSTIRAFIFKNGGDDNNVNDIFTYSILTFIKQCYRPLFTLNKDANAYLFSIAKYEWIRLTKKQRQLVSDHERPELVDDINAETLILDKEKKSSLKKAMHALDKKCRDVLTMWSNNLRMREIALKMNYKSEGMARKKKHECMNKLRTILQLK